MSVVAATSKTNSLIVLVETTSWRKLQVRILRSSPKSAFLWIKHSSVFTS